MAVGGCYCSLANGAALVSVDSAMPAKYDALPLRQNRNTSWSRSTMKCDYCQEKFPAKHLYGLVPGGAQQCPPCIESWCDDWEPEMKKFTDVVRERNRKPLTRFLAWQDGQWPERQELN